MLKDISRLFLDQKIGRREFIRRLGVAGVTATSAAALATHLEGPAARADTPTVPAPENPRKIEGATGGELVAEFLMDWDVPYVFGLAGSEEVGLLDAFVDRTALQFTTCLHENCAMAMADGYSRSTGKTSVVQLHSVAGAAFALGQMVSSFKDRIPVVIMVGRQSTNFRGHDGFLEAPGLHELPKDYARWTWDVMNAATIPEVMRRAFLLAEAPPGGPSFVTISKDLFETRVPETEIVPRSRSVVSTDVAPNAAHVKALADYLLSADFPMLFLGNECIRHEISDTVAEIAELTGAGVMFSVKIPCVFPTTHPHFVGEVMDDPSLFARTDCFWSIGGHMFKFFNRPREAVFKKNARILHTSLVESEVGRNYPVDLAAIASIKTTTEQVLAELKTRQTDTAAIRARRVWFADYAAARKAKFTKEAEAAHDQVPIATSRLMIELNKAIDKGAYIVSELISSDDHPRRYLDFDHKQPASERRRNFYTTSGVLGWGVAAAIGTKIGNPNKEVWCLTGDGSFNFGCQALWSAARYEVPVGIVIFNNGQYQSNRINSARLKGRMYETGKYIGVDLGHPTIDHVALAKAYGVAGEVVEQPDDIAPALLRAKAAMAAGKPYLVDIKIEKRFDGKESDWFDHYSVASGTPRQS
ncbi:MAG: thiamine pyrophosphate-binding protein [Alphaproteobacteria bacterium]|nr:MAG: thiamine pyrophosphate-binding protein [Alphaproteobacteria bacterium]